MWLTHGNHLVFVKLRRVVGEVANQQSERLVRLNLLYAVCSCDPTSVVRVWQELDQNESVALSSDYNPIPIVVRPCSSGTFSHLGQRSGKGVMAYTWEPVAVVCV